MIASRIVRLAPMLALAATLASAAPRLQDAKAAAPPAPPKEIVQSASLVWGPGPPVLPAGMKFVLLSGDPGAAGPFTLRAQLPAGYRIPPHWHPTEENVTVLSGTLSMGMSMGDAIDAKSMQTLTAGGFAHMAANMRHSLVAKTATVIQVHGIGPFQITYVNPADDPRNAAPKK